MKQLADLKVAIVCDWLTGTGGAERVVLELHKMFPQAPIYTSQYDDNPTIWYGGSWFSDAEIHTLWLQKLPKKLRKFLPILRARAFSKLDLSSFDVVISSAGAEAKAVKTGPATVHISYIHAPTHYYWSRYNEYLAHPGFGFFNPLARVSLKLLAKPMRRWDYRAAQRPNYLLANSYHTQAEIKRYYGRNSVVIHPPVDTGRFNSLSLQQRSGFVIAGRQTPYKRVDLAVAACTMLDVPLTVIGNGPDHPQLRAIAGPTIRFVTDASDAAIADYFIASKAFIFPALDDFGITAVEAMAAGTPVIAYKAGGALDYVTPARTGEFFEEQSVESLAAVLRDFDSSKYHSHDIKTVAEQFSVSQFHENLQKELTRILK